MENDFLKLIKSRRSCRHFKPEQVTDEELQAVLEAGTYAPSGHNLQNCFIVALQQPEQMKQLAELNAKIWGITSNPYYDAPTYVFVFAPGDSGNAFQDGSCILENMMLAAHAIGLGSCWINREKQMFDTEEGKILMKEWGLPDGLIGIGATKRRILSDYQIRKGAYRLLFLLICNLCGLLFYIVSANHHFRFLPVRVAVGPLK